MSTLHPLAVLAAICALAGCQPEPPPLEQPPEPQATAAAKPANTELRDAIQAPQDKARAVEDTLQQADQKRREELEAAEQ
ncbi:hypothetical protein CSC70_03080 [Pseudoxanthomonas kalamensis DSM 18571]|uniref:hypothetical protein n=1 Tax=Pseudoxanthomonas kalamensis TaxID=289483 RepID=UPI0013919252|nr:hypothetical protein [Pseudoxanthomonas kalamensis]KAF1712511.1 hypothetical protein CSC70_03080 [Pseudoxanthomonas kalamensis DSM 18571]